MGTVRVRQLRSRDEYELPMDEEVLLVPHELPEQIGVCERKGDAMVECDDGGSVRLARAKAARLGDCHPGERVLVEFEGPYIDPPGWWLCEVEAVDGDDYAGS